MKVDMDNRHPHTPLILLGLVGANILLQLTSASLIKLAASHHVQRLLIVSLIIAVVVFLNFGRFAVWGMIHKRFPVSVAYPASAIFFPCLVILSYCYGETVSVKQVFGAVIVSTGVLLLLSPSRRARGSKT